MKKYLMMFLGLFGSLMLTTALVAGEGADFGALDANQDGYLSAEEAAVNVELSADILGLAYEWGAEPMAERPPANNVRDIIQFGYTSPCLRAKANSDSTPALNIHIAAGSGTGEKVTSRDSWLVSLAPSPDKSMEIIFPSKLILDCSNMVTAPYDV